jgi:hypothetical protein
VRRLAIYVGLMLAAGFGSAISQSPAASPEEVARQFFKAEHEDRWLDAAHLLDLRRFEAIRQMTVKGLRMARAPFRLTPEAIMRSQPDMPRAVAEYEAKKTNKQMEEFNLLAYQFARVPSADSLEALPVDEAAARWLEAQGPKWVDERDRKTRPPMKCPGMPDSVAVRSFGRFNTPDAVVLGATAGDSVRYVVVGLRSAVTRSRVDDFESAMSPHVLTLVNVNGAWRVVPSPDMITYTGFSGNTSFSIACEVETPAKARSNQLDRR